VPSTRARRCGSTCASSSRDLHAVLQKGTPMRPNRLRERLRSGPPTSATHIHTVCRAVAELAGHAGVFDYVEFVGEYAPYDLFALENLARAVETFPHLSAMMKIEQQPRTYLAVRAIR